MRAAIPALRRAGGGSIINVASIYETFAFIRRRNARLSPATRALMTLAEQHLMALAGGYG